MDGKNIVVAIVIGAVVVAALKNPIGAVAGMSTASGALTTETGILSGGNNTQTGSINMGNGQTYQIA